MSGQLTFESLTGTEAVALICERVDVEFISGAVLDIDDASNAVADLAKKGINIKWCFDYPDCWHDSLVFRMPEGAVQ